MVLVFGGLVVWQFRPFSPFRRFVPFKGLLLASCTVAMGGQTWSLRTDELCLPRVAPCADVVRR